MRANDIINKAKKDIEAFIAFELPLLYLRIHKNFPNFSKDEELVIKAEELDKEIIINSLECLLKEIRLSLDEKVFVIFDNGIDDEIAFEDLTINEIVEISNAVQRTYEKLVKQK